MAPPTPHIQSEGKVTRYVTHTINHTRGNLREMRLFGSMSYNLSKVGTT